MKAHKKLSIAIAFFSLSCLAMEDSKLENLSHEELAIKQNALAANYIVEIIKNSTLNSMLDQGITHAQFEKCSGIFDTFEKALAEPMLEEHMRLSDEQLRNFISIYSNAQMIEIEKEFSRLPTTLGRFYEDLMPKEDTLKMLDLPTDSLGERSKIFESTVIEGSDGLNALVLRNSLFLFDQSIREKFAQGVDSYNFLVSIRNQELDTRIGEMVKKHMPAIQEELQHEAIKILFGHWESKSNRL